MSDAHRQLLQNTGTSHLFAISGLHVGMVAWLVFVLVRWLWSSIPALLLRVPAQRLAALVSALAAFLYVALSGWEIPAQRTLIMLVMFYWLLFRQNYYPKRLILVRVLSVVLLLQPQAVVSAGFWLSFVACIVILWEMRSPSRWPTWLRVQWVVSIAMLPLTGFFFAQIALVSPLANLVAIPLFSFLIVPASLLGALLLPVPLLGQGCFGVADRLLDWVWSGLDWLAQVPMLPVAAVSLPALLLMGLGIVYWLLPARLPWRHVGLLPLGWLFCTQPSGVPYQSVRLTVLDVGQGLAVLVQTRSHQLLYDAGAKFSDRLDAGKAVVVPYLRYWSVPQLDKVIISHGDNDHRGGLLSVMAAIPVAELLSGEPHRLAANQAKPCHAGQSWHWDGVDFELLSPPADSRWEKNNRSCVLLITAGKRTALLTGDIEKIVEQSLLRLYPALHADVMVVPHHGSLTSSTDAFVRTVGADIAVVSAGYYNRFSHPREKVVQRYQNSNATLWNTAYSGAVMLQAEPGGWQATAYRQVHQHVWMTQE